MQCFMPVIEFLLGTGVDNGIVLDMVFDLAMFGSLGKLRYQVPDTLEALDQSAVNIGKDVRQFAKKTCPRIITHELPKETAARGRRTARLRKDGSASVARKEKRFNYETYKFHSLRDYAAMCRMYGSTDNTTSQIVSVRDISQGSH